MAADLFFFVCVRKAACHNNSVGCDNGVVGGPRRQTFGGESASLSKAITRCVQLIICGSNHSVELGCCIYSFCSVNIYLSHHL